ncbi:MAG: hypothetical protein WBM28_07640 [Burkholderiales bacterium]
MKQNAAASARISSPANGRTLHAPNQAKPAQPSREERRKKSAQKTGRKLTHYRSAGKPQRAQKRGIQRGFLDLKSSFITCFPSAVMRGSPFHA